MFSNHWLYFKRNNKHTDIFPSPYIFFQAPFNKVNVDIWQANCKYGVWNSSTVFNYPISTCSNWYIWENWDKICTISTNLFGKGRGLLGFGNCWSTGVVKLYLNGTEIESAGPGESKEVSFDFNGGSKLEVMELDTAIIQINSFVLGKFVCVS